MTRVNCFELHFYENLPRSWKFIVMISLLLRYILKDISKYLLRCPWKLKKKNREIYYCCILFLNVYWLFGITHNIQPEPSLTPQTFRKVSFKMYVGNFEKEIKESWYSEFPELIYFKAHLSGFLEIKNYSSGN